jgi:hypothetical protein
MVKIMGPSPTPTVANYGIQAFVLSVSHGTSYADGGLASNVVGNIAGKALRQKINDDIAAKRSFWSY